LSGTDDYDDGGAQVHVAVDDQVYVDSHHGLRALAMEPPVREM